MKPQILPYRPLLVLLVLVGAAACSARRPDQVRRSGSILLEPGTPASQTFVARYDGLQAVEVYLETLDDLPETLQVRLWDAGSDAPTPLFQIAFPLPAGIEPGWLALPVELQSDSAGEFFRLEIEPLGNGSLVLGSGAPESYRDGGLVLGGQHFEAQMAFRLGYRTLPALFGLLGEGLLAAGMIALAGVVFVLPGWALLSRLDSGWASRALFERLVLSAGAGLALYPVLFLWTHLAGWNLGGGYLWLPPLAGLVSLLLRRRADPGRSENPKGSTVSFRPDWMVIGVVALLLFSRLWPLRTLEAGMWGDSVHHTLIARLLLDNGGLFSSWQPYADLTTFTYHFGFHSAAALMAWGAGLPAEKAVLWAGQLVNVLAVLALYPLARKLAAPLGARPARWAGLAAVLLAGFAAPMPAAYTNWGRYTQVAGQAVLLVWMALAVDAFERPSIGRRTSILHGLLLAGLGLTHYRVLIFALLFVFAYAMLHLRGPGLLGWVKKLAWIGVPGAVLFLPWFWRVFGGQIMYIVGSQLATPAGQVSQTIENYNRIGDLSVYLPLWVWWLLPALVLWGALSRDRAVLVIALWGGLLFLLANPGRLGLPGAGAVNNFAVLIAAYMPAALLVGLAAGHIRHGWDGRLPSFSTPLGALPVLLVLAAAGWGAIGQIRLVRPAGHSLVTRPDVLAAGWIRENTPADALFLVNAFEAGSGTTAAGSDAGWWLPLLAGRKITMPPFIYIAEQNLDPEYGARLLALTAAVNRDGPDDPGVKRMLSDWGVSHVYIGQLQGSVNSRGQAIDPSSLEASLEFELVYQQDRVWIFTFSP